MKKAFTLIELLAVIIILAVVALIATPIVLDVITDSKESVAKSTAYMLVDGAKNYYAESMFDQNKSNKIKNLSNIYNEVEMAGNKPNDGELYVNDKGVTALAVVINNKCYKKEFGGDLQITEDSDCKLGYVGSDEESPTVTLNVINNPFNELGWANNDFYINIVVIDNESGAYSYKWCSDINDCEPLALVEESSGSVLVSIESVNTVVCVIGYDKAGNNSSKTCSESYKLDKQKPMLTAISNDIEITKDDDTLVSSYFDVSYSISGGSISCTPENTNSLSAGNQTVSCTATGGNDLSESANKNILVIYIEPNGPLLFNKMIPVKWNGSNWIYANVNEKWYDYNNKEWANAVVLNSGVTKTVGQTVSESEMAMMYVWIPRYKYTIFNGNNEVVNEQQIKVTFESGTNSTGTVKCNDAISGSGLYSETCSDSTNGSIINGTSTYTHPAFCLGHRTNGICDGTELTGIWVGKFEIGTTNATCNNNQNDDDCNKVLPIVIKPNIQSWRYAKLSTFYNSIKNIASNYGINADSHMIKNMEWGAVSYLTQSKYGRCDNGICTEIAKNDSSKYYTGRSQGFTPATSAYSADGTHTYELSLGQLASTTGSIYGIYDMSGGAMEYVMGNMVNSSNQFVAGNTGFSTSPASKYLDTYTYDSSSYTTHSRGKLGDATKEILKEKPSTGWYDSGSEFLGTASWFIRMGHYNLAKPSNMFTYSYYMNGDKSRYSSSRAVISAP